MNRLAITNQLYQPLPPVKHYRSTQGIIYAVTGALSDFYQLGGVLEFIGLNRHDAAQLANPANWEAIGSDYFLEIPAQGAPTLMYLLSGPYVRYVTSEHPGPFRIPGCQPFTATDEPSEFAGLAELAHELRQLPANYRGRVVVQPSGVCQWVAFEDEAGSTEWEWQPLPIALGLFAHDSYAYDEQGQRLSNGSGAGRCIVWQEILGQQRLFVEPDAANAELLFPTLRQVSASQLAQYQFEFTPFGQPGDREAQVATASLEEADGASSVSAEDWLPEYPPQEDDWDDNQDGNEYPEYPEDEQRDLLDNNA